MPHTHRSRILYAVLTCLVLLLGLISRRFSDDLPFVRAYIGDVLWALMVFFGFALIFNRWPVRLVALVSLLFAFSVEFSQLYHAPWLDAIRSTRLGGLVLGFSFVWTDLLCYSVGVVIGVGVERGLISSA